jgi:hypothetical protein
LADYQEQSRDNLRLVFCATGKDTGDDFDEDTYELRLLDALGMIAMRLRLPADILKPVIFSQTEIFVFMTPDGAVAASPADVDAYHSPELVALDELVERAIAPRMLDDEPGAARMLQTLRDRLRSAMRLVEDALDKMPK